MNAGRRSVALVGWQVRRRLGQPVVSLVAPCIFPLLTFGVVDLAFGRVVGPFLPHSSYAAYLVPLVIVNTILFGGSAEGAEAWRDFGTGITRRLASFDVDLRGFSAARSLGYGVMAVIQATAVALTLGLATGLTRSVGGFFAYLGLMGWLGVGVGMLVASLGFRSRVADDVPGIIYAVFLPLTFLSTAYIPLRLFPAAAQPFVRANPVTWIAQCARSLLAGQGLERGQLVGAIGIAVVLFAVGTSLLVRSPRAAVAVR